MRTTESPGDPPTRLDPPIQGYDLEWRVRQLELGQTHANQRLDSVDATLKNLEAGVKIVRWLATALLAALGPQGIGWMVSHIRFIPDQPQAPIYRQFEPPHPEPTRQQRPQPRGRGPAQPDHTLPEQYQ